MGHCNDCYYSQKPVARITADMKRHNLNPLSAQSGLFSSGQKARENLTRKGTIALAIVPFRYTGGQTTI